MVTLAGVVQVVHWVRVVLGVAVVAAVVGVGVDVAFCPVSAAGKPGRVVRVGVEVAGVVAEAPGVLVQREERGERQGRQGAQQ